MLAGADQDTVTDVAGSAPQVSRSCSGAVVAGSGNVVVGGPDGAVAANASWCHSGPSVARASPTTAPKPTTPVRKPRRVSQARPAAGGPDSLLRDSPMAGTVEKTS